MLIEFKIHDRSVQSPNIVSMRTHKHWFREGHFINWGGGSGGSLERRSCRVPQCQPLTLSSTLCGYGSHADSRLALPSPLCQRCMSLGVSCQALRCPHWAWLLPTVTQPHRLYSRGTMPRLGLEVCLPVLPDHYQRGEEERGRRKTCGRRRGWR